MLCAIHQAGPRLKKCTYMGTVEEVGPSMQALLDDPLMTHPDVQKAKILFFFTNFVFKNVSGSNLFWCHKKSCVLVCLPCKGPVNRVVRTCVFVGCKMLRRLSRVVVGCRGVESSKAKKKK